MPEPQRKPLASRIYMRASRDLTQSVRAVYLHLYALPFLRLKGELPQRYWLTRGQGVYLVLTAERFLKVAVSVAMAPDREYANYGRLRAAFPALADLLPGYRLIRNFGLSVLACEALVQVPYTEAMAPAVTIYRRFLRQGRAGTRLTLAGCPHIRAGLDEIAARFGVSIAQEMQQQAEAFLANASYTIGPVHGDFHSRNMMRAMDGRFRLIDLDCVRLAGVTEFDALYFAVEQEWSATGRLWTAIVAESLATVGDNIAPTLAAFGVDWTSGLGLAFFLDRIGQDLSNYGTVYERQALQVVIDAARKAA